MRPRNAGLLAVVIACVLAGAPAAHADVVVEQPLAADSGDSCGVAKGVLGWQSTPIVTVSGVLRDTKCGDDGRHSIASFAAFVGARKVDGQVVRADDADEKLNFKLANTGSAAAIERVVVQVCRGVEAAGPPFYCGPQREFRSPVGPAAGIRAADAPGAIAGSYIVVLKDGTQVDAVTGRHNGIAVETTYRSVLHGFAASMTEELAKQVAADPDVAYVEQNHVVQGATEQVNPPSWGLDRVDQASRTLNNRYGYPDDGGSRVNAYVIDSGIRFSHNEFGGRATSGFDVVDGGMADDCHGHGTHVAGTIGGATYGVAKSVRLIAVRVLGCDNRGTVADFIEGIDWVTTNHVKPAVANLSIAADNPSDAFDTAVNDSIAAGVHYVIAAGNANVDACGESPSRVRSALIVGATNRDDSRASFSNTGPCVDLFAPGVDIVSAGLASDTATATMSGTSMAAPHVTGVVALLLQVHPNLIVESVSGHIKATATTGVVTDPGSGSPNALLRLIDGPVTGLAGKCADARGTANGAPVQLFDCNAIGGQEWQFTGSALYNGRSGRCLDVTGGVMTNSTPTQLFDCNGTQAQAWRWSPERQELFIRADTARCLDVRGGNSANGTPIQIFDCNNTGAQNWNLPVN